MSTPQEKFQKFLDEQRAEYKITLPQKMADVRALWQAVHSGDAEATPMVELQRLAHTLAGTAGTLGFGEVGSAAKALELLLEQAVEVGPALTLTQRSQIALAIDTLQAALPGP